MSLATDLYQTQVQTWPPPTGANLGREAIQLGLRGQTIEVALPRSFYLVGLIIFRATRTNLPSSDVTKIPRW
jgi:hypothetical protein